MKDWSDYTKTKTTSGSSEDSKPSIKEYMLIKLTDNFLAFAVFILFIILFSVGLFAELGTKTDWTLHAAELCLGVFLGLLKKQSK